MSDYIHLQGAEDVRSAGHSISNAASEMRSAASTIDSAVRDFKTALDEHHQFMRGLLEDFQTAIDKART